MHTRAVNFIFFPTDFCGFIILCPCPCQLVFPIFIFNIQKKISEFRSAVNFMYFFFPKKSSEKSGRRWLTHFNDPSLCSSKPIPCFREGLLNSSVQTLSTYQNRQSIFFIAFLSVVVTFDTSIHTSAVFLIVLFGRFEISFFSVAP